MTRAAVLAGLGAYLPPRVVTNEQLGDALGVSDDWIFSRTGIRQRHMVDRGTATSDLAARAGANALRSAAHGTADTELDTRVDAVIVATATPDHIMPATAPIVAARLGLSNPLAFDLNAVCTGFVYGLATSAALITSGLAQRVLLIGADTFSTVTDARDRVVYPLFGDGAGAVLLRAGDASEPGALTAFDLGSDGEKSDLIMVRAGGSREREAAEPQHRYLSMQGKEVFMNAVLRMAESSRNVLARAGRELREVAAVVGHQANIRILRAVAAQLDLPAERLVTNLDRVGNTSAASIPLALAHALEQRALAAEQLILLTAFGSGLTWGSAVLKWPNITLGKEGM